MGALFFRLVKFFALFCGSLVLLALVSITGLWLYVAWQLPTAASIVSRPMETCPVAVGNQPVQLSELPSYLPNAFVVAKEPFSTVLAENSVHEAFPSDRISLWWHMRNFVQAGRIQIMLTKDQILAAALNQMYFGNGAAGLNCAAYRYFEKPASKLTISEAALLAGLVKGPSIYDPVTHPDRALERRNWVIAQLLRNGFISETDAKEAASNAILIVPIK